MVADGVFKPASKGIPITIKGVLPNEPKRPEWMKVKANLGSDYRSLKNLLNDMKKFLICLTDQLQIYLLLFLDFY